MRIQSVAEEIVVAMYGGHNTDAVKIVVDILEKYYSNGVAPVELIMDCRKSLAAAVPELRKIQQLCFAADHILDAARQDAKPDRDTIKHGDLSTRAYNVIKCVNARRSRAEPIDTWTELAQKTTLDLRLYRGLGPSIESELRTALAKRGLCFADE